MNWKVKSVIQKVCVATPVGRERTYFFVQDWFGRLRKATDAVQMLSACSDLVSWLQNANVQVEGARVMEIGTGRCIHMPIGFYLAGACSTVTVDLTRYLNPSLVLEWLTQIRRRKDEISNLFQGLVNSQALDRRLRSLCNIRTFRDLMETAHITYLAPADAAHMPLPSHSIDIQTSYTVFEHVPRPVLTDI